MISDERRSINRENPNSSSIPVGTRCRPRFREKLSHAEDHSDRGKDEEHDLSSVRLVDGGPDYKRDGTVPGPPLSLRNPVDRPMTEDRPNRKPSMSLSFYGTDLGNASSSPAYISI